jgi:hypothetical protein
MTEDERKTMIEMRERMNDMYRDLFEGPSSGEPPMFERMSSAVQFFERSSWMGRMLTRGFIALGSIAAAAMAIWALFHTTGGTGK